MLSTKAGKEAYVEPVIENGGYRFTVKVGKPKDAEAAKNGTKLARGANFQCLMSGTPIAGDYIKAEGKAGRMGARLMAIVAEGERGRVYLAPTPEHGGGRALRRSRSGSRRSTLPGSRADFATPHYGLTTFGDLFTPRQLVALTTFSDLVQEARERVQARRPRRRPARRRQAPARRRHRRHRLRRCGGGVSGVRCRQGRRLQSTLCVVEADRREHACNTFARQAIPMVWDYRGGQPIRRCGRRLRRHARLDVAKVLDSCRARLGRACAAGRCAAQAVVSATRSSPPIRPTTTTSATPTCRTSSTSGCAARCGRSSLTSSPRSPCPRPRNWSPRPTATAARRRRRPSSSTA